MKTFKQLQEKLSDKEYKEVDALLNRDTLLRGNLMNPVQRQKFASMSGRDTFRRLKRNKDGKLRIDRGTEKKIKVNTQTVSKNFPELFKKPVKKYANHYTLPPVRSIDDRLKEKEAIKKKYATEGVASLALKGGSKLIPALMTGIGAVGTYLQAKRSQDTKASRGRRSEKPKRKLSRMAQKQIEIENKRGENVTKSDPYKGMIKPKSGEVRKTEAIIRKHEKANKVIKPKEGEITKQRELLKNVEKRITKPKKGEKKDASKTVKDFLKARKKEGETMYRLKQDAELADKGPGDLLPAAKKSYLEKLRRNLRKPENQFHTEDAIPTNNVSGGQIAGTVEAGDNPPVKKKKKTYAYGGRGSRKMWMNNK